MCLNIISLCFIHKGKNGRDMNYEEPKFSVSLNFPGETKFVPAGQATRIILQLVFAFCWRDGLGTAKISGWNCYVQWMDYLTKIKLRLKVKAEIFNFAFGME